MSGRQPIESIAFVGLGLIGMSLLLAFRRSAAYWQRPVEMVGFDPGFGREDQLEACSMGLDCFSGEMRELCRADLIILAAPVEANIALLTEISRFATPSTLVSDVSSTKAGIGRKAGELSLPFIGMHPMAGKERQGYREAQASLFEGKPTIICAEEAVRNSPKGRALQELLALSGTRLVFMDAEEHDRVVARVSHLPQLLSTLLIDCCRQDIDKSGPGFASMTRLAGSPWGIWRDIVATNSLNIADELDRFSRKLAEMSSEIRKGEFSGLEARFNEANRLHQRLREEDCQ